MNRSVCESVMPQCVGSEVYVGIIACLLIILHLGGRRRQVDMVPEIGGYKNRILGEVVVGTS